MNAKELRRLASPLIGKNASISLLWEAEDWHIRVEALDREGHIGFVRIDPNTGKGCEPYFEFSADKITAIRQLSDKQ
jgi:hypothetical protein